MTDNVTCPTCGAVYARRMVKVMWRDKDTFECCDNVLASWNASRFPMFELVKPGRKPEAKDA